MDISPVIFFTIKEKHLRVLLFTCRLFILKEIIGFYSWSGFNYYSAFVQSSIGHAVQDLSIKITDVNNKKY